LRYRIVEPFPIWQDRQRQTLHDFRDKLEWRESLEPFAGIHFSNELLDAMPIDLPGKLIDLDNDDFVFVDGPAGGRSNQAALDWIDNVSTNLQCGYVIALDYGHVTDSFAPAIQVRAKHRHLQSPFGQIGHADITAHVDWRSIAQHAKKVDLAVAGFADQHHFLTGLLTAQRDLFQARSLGSFVLNEQAVEGASKAKTTRELQTLIHPEMMGRSFQALALSKNVDPDVTLAGFRFARESDI